MLKKAEEIKKLENKILNDVLYFALGNKYKDELENAKKIFLTMLKNDVQQEKEMGFTLWLLWDYKLQNGNTFFEEYKEINRSKLSAIEMDLLDSIGRSFISVYESEYKGDKLVLNDIFLNKKIILNNDFDVFDKTSKSLVIGRVFTYNNNFYLMDDFVVLDKLFKGAIERSFHEKYNEYSEKYKFKGVYDFIKENSLLIYKFTSIIDDLIKKQNENDKEYKVFQTSYIIINLKIVKSYLLDNENIELDYEEDEVLYLRLYTTDKRKILSELLLYPNKLELECISQGDQTQAKKTIESLIGDYLQHIKDEVIHLEDII